MQFRELLERPDWHRFAACRGMDPEWWFPARGADTRRAKAICAGCPVREECLAEALANRERFGIFGGTSERERIRLRATRPRQSVCIECGATFTPTGFRQLCCGEPCSTARHRRQVYESRQRRKVS